MLNTERYSDTSTALAAPADALSLEARWQSLGTQFEWDNSQLHRLLAGSRAPLVAQLADSSRNT